MSATTAGNSHVVVVGAGIVGVCCGLYLQRAGQQVTLIDRLPPGDEGAASYGNAGSISWSSCIPTAMPGVASQVPGWLLNRDGPLTIRWRHLPTLAPWLWRFMRAGNERSAIAAASALAMLHAPSLELHQDLARSAAASDLIGECDYMHVYSKALPDRLAKLEWRLRAEHGAKLELLDGAELAERVPQIAARYPQTVSIRGQGFVRNPGRLVAAYAAHLCADGGTIVNTEVTGFDHHDGTVRAVLTANGPVQADQFVIAAGPWSSRLTRLLGYEPPLDTERGYHISVRDAGIDLSQTIMETDAKFVVTPMESGLRFAGTVELASIDAEPDYGRADAIGRSARRMFPDIRLQHVDRWMGRRPSLPDGLPVIGPMPGYGNVLLAFGHAHTGMVGAPQTGRLIANLAVNKPDNFDLAAFSAARF